MGASVSCLCPDHDPTKKRLVIVMKEDGELIRVADGTRARDVLDANPYHKLIRSCSDRSTIPDSCQMSCNSLYFLLPVGLAVSDSTYRSLVRAAASKGLIRSDEGREEGKDRKVLKAAIVSGAGDKGVEKSEPIAFESGDFGGKRPTWKPALKTVPEVTSPAP